MNGTQRSTLVIPEECIVCTVAKGTSQTKVMSNSEKIKPIALAIVELRESEGIRQAGSYCS